jgi:cytoskeletal protein RodZ
MKRISILAILVMVFGLLPAAFAQQSQPSQPPDPTAQAPATQAPTTPPTFPESKSKPSQSPEAQSQQSSETSQSAAKVFTGTIEQVRHGYVLRVSGQDYKLDDQAKAKAYSGKQVKVQGTLDPDTNIIHVDKIEEAPSL